MTHVRSFVPGDALLPWAGADPQQRRRGTPAGERPGDPLCRDPRPPGGGEGPGEVLLHSLAPGRWALPAACAGKEESGVCAFRRGATGCHGRDENRERPWALQSCGWVQWLSCAEQGMCSPLGEEESCYFTGRQNI